MFRLTAPSGDEIRRFISGQKNSSLSYPKVGASATAAPTGYNADHNRVDGTHPTNHAEHETVEITHGFNDWFECGFYIFTSITQGQGWQWVGDHIRPRVAVPNKWHWPVGVSPSNEIGYQRRQYSADTWTGEVRAIVDQKVGRSYWSLNPTLDRSFHGENVHKGVIFSPNAKFSFDLTRKIAAGLEYYGSVDPVTGFDPLSQLQHQIFRAIDLNIAPQWELNFGLGLGLTGSTDHLIAQNDPGLSL